MNQFSLNTNIGIRINGSGHPRYVHAVSADDIRYLAVLDQGGRYYTFLIRRTDSDKVE